MRLERLRISQKTKDCFRRQILGILSNGDRLSAVEIADKMGNGVAGRFGGLNSYRVTYYLRDLRCAGLVEMERDRETNGFGLWFIVRR